ncbi:MAG: BatD family protein [Proteobacteria bacterium]|nr:BatD family protein [Pseudomonadota bacterium]MBU1716574.1 BatD family protein [Pseudomonadota bacterium]
MRLNRFFLIIIFLVTAVPELAAQELSVQAVVERQEVYVGESFTMQIQVEGDDAPLEPDLASITDFTVQPRGGQKNSSSSISIVNGKYTQVSRHGYIFNFSLTAKKTGRLLIPSLTVNAGGKSMQTAPINIIAKKPEESDEFKLRIQLSKEQCYVGEPVILTVTWYIGQRCDDIEFNLPIMTDQRFELVDPDPVANTGDKDKLLIPMAGREIVATRGQAKLEGRDYTTVTFQQVLIPRQAGIFILPEATVACKVITGYQQNQRHDPFGSFFGRGQQPVYQQVVTPANQPSLKANALPANGRPANFSGLIGKFTVAATAEPTEVNVGDPITLTIMLAGPQYLKNATMPPLGGQPELALNFKIPDEISPGEIQGHRKIFIQTIRAKHAGLKEIPALKLPYFNPESGTYETALSAPIPLQVKASRQVTAQDAEGLSLPSLGRELNAVSQGIAHNYEDESVLIGPNTTLTTNTPGRWWLLFLIFPPALYILLLAGRYYQNRKSRDPQGHRARKAQRKFSTEINKIKTANILRLEECLRQYLGAKLALAPGAITYKDVQPRLQKKGIPAEILNELKKIFDQFEAQRYAGEHFSENDFQTTITRCKNVVASLERSLR